MSLVFIVHADSVVCWEVSPQNPKPKTPEWESDINIKYDIYH